MIVIDFNSPYAQNRKILSSLAGRQKRKGWKVASPASPLTERSA